MRATWLIGPVIGAAFGMAAVAWQARAQNADQQTEIYRQLDLFADVLAKVQADYVAPTDDKQLMEAAINGMLASLDPHSSYSNAEQFDDLQVHTKGEYGGLGIEVTSEDGVVKVIAPIDETPASRAGIQSGDLIVAIEGESIIGLTLDESVDKMRGPVNTPITISIVREGKEPFDVKLTRETITPRVVTSRLEGDVGYVRLSTFNEKTLPGLEDALAKLRRESSGRLSGLVLDLRNNPGGLLDQAIGVSDMFLDGGEVVSTRGRDPLDIQRYNARRGDILAGLPIVVLINGGSASASEIVAGALQDRQRALLVGTQSFGKGSVQTVIPLNGGRDGALRLTTAKYYTPSGRSIQAEGIVPDFEILNAKRAADARPQIAERNLPHALKGEGETPVATPPRPPAEQPPAEFDGKGDYQLRRALEIIKSKNPSSKVTVAQKG
jgi:carboxyl-terminal processing protease